MYICHLESLPHLPVLGKKYALFKSPFFVGSCIIRDFLSSPWWFTKEDAAVIYILDWITASVTLVILDKTIDSWLSSNFKILVNFLMSEVCYLNVGNAILILLVFHFLSKPWGNISYVKWIFLIIFQMPKSYLLYWSKNTVYESHP